MEGRTSQVHRLVHTRCIVCPCASCRDHSQLKTLRLRGVSGLPRRPCSQSSAAIPTQSAGLKLLLKRSGCLRTAKAVPQGWDGFSPALPALRRPSQTGPHGAVHRHPSAAPLLALHLVRRLNMMTSQDLPLFLWEHVRAGPGTLALLQPLGWVEGQGEVVLCWQQTGSSRKGGRGAGEMPGELRGAASGPRDRESLAGMWQRRFLWVQLRGQRTADFHPLSNSHPSLGNPGKVAGVGGRLLFWIRDGGSRS